MKYGYSKKVDLSFVDAIEATKEALTKEGFGVLTEIDVKATLRKKLDVHHDNYMILGACNPKLAHTALQAEKEIGLLLPCNVIVYEDDAGVHVSAIVPSVAMSMVDNEKLPAIAETVEAKLKNVIDAL